MADQAREGSSTTTGGVPGQPITVHPAPAVAHVGPLGFRNFALQFLQAARVVSETAAPFSPVAYYLLCHSVELSLKAFLLIQHVPLEELKRRQLGHNLQALLTRAQTLGLTTVVPLSAEQSEAIAQATHYYTGKVFEYFELTEAFAGYKKKPSFEHLQSAATSLVQQLEKPCLAAI
ncbi:MAG: hypothetical protein ABSG37_12010 [Candidatus Limnocylindrales bacterium]|jgi:hypothetical protein